MIFCCNKCGNKLTKEDVRCPKCGNGVSDATVNRPPEPEASGEVLNVVSIKHRAPSDSYAVKFSFGEDSSRYSVEDIRAISPQAAVDELLKTLRVKNPEKEIRLLSREKPIKKWWDLSQTIRGADKLSHGQREFILSGSFVVFGPLNVLFRRHWDMLIALFAIRLVADLMYFLDSEIWIAAVLIYGPLTLLAAYGYSHGRRLSWNRQEWENFEEFAKSEKKWRVWGLIVIAIFVASIAF